MTDFIRLADKLAGLLENAIQYVPKGFLDSFEYTSTGKNLTHSITLGIITRVIWNLPNVDLVGIDVRLNLGGGVKFQPDIVAFNKNLRYLLFLDYESPNSSDARVPTKDFDAYYGWSQKSKLATPYVIITTLLDYNAPTWELRYTSPGYPNQDFRGRHTELAQNPFRFWYNHYKDEFTKRCIGNIALLNISGKKVKRVLPESA